MEYEDHPIADIFPLLNEAELAELAEDIRANGMQVPIVLFEGKILDGRNRYRAARKVGAHIPQNYYTGDSPTAHVISLNLKRRQLTPSQKAAVAADALPFFEAEAKKREDTGRPKEGKEKIPDVLKGQARDKAAAATGANPRYVQDAKKLKAESPEVFEKVRAGTVTIPQAKAEVSRAIPIPAPTFTPAEQARVDQAEKDSEALWALKSQWKKTNKKDRSAFLKWAAKN